MTWFLWLILAEVALILAAIVLRHVVVYGIRYEPANLDDIPLDLLIFFAFGALILTSLLRGVWLLLFG